MVIHYYNSDRNALLFNQLKAKTALVNLQQQLIARRQKRLVLTAESIPLDLKSKSVLYTTNSIFYVGQLREDGNLKDVFTTPLMDGKPPLSYPLKPSEKLFFIKNKMPLLVHYFSNSGKNTQETQKKHLQTNTSKAYVVVTSLGRSFYQMAKASKTAITFIERQGPENEILYSSLSEEEQTHLKNIFNKYGPTDTLNMQNEKYKIYSFSLFKRENFEQAMIHSYKKINRPAMNNFLLLLGGLTLFCLSTLLVFCGYWWAESKTKT